MATLQREQGSSRPSQGGVVPKLWRAGFLLFYLAWLVAAELLASGIDVTAGLWLHAALLVSLTVHAALGDETAQLYTAMSVLPLIRILSLAMPVWLTAEVHWFALINVPLILGALIAARTLRYSRRELGLRWGVLPVQLLIVLSGPVIGYSERLIIQPNALASSTQFSHLIWPVLSLMIFTGLSEELLFRGVLQRAAVNTIGAGWGILYGALLFAVLHLGWHSWLDVGFVALVGLLFGWIAHKTGSILGITLAHGLANIMLFVVMPLATT